jgi:hypothetical protein
MLGYAQYFGNAGVYFPRRSRFRRGLADKEIDTKQLHVVLSAIVLNLAKHLPFVWSGIAKDFHRFVDDQHSLGISYRCR